MPTPLVTRFAPSTAGHLHLGNARTALLNHLAARKTGGRFILRVEDADEARSSDAFINELCGDLRWLGLTWDEGPDIGGPHSLYRLQQRSEIYENWLAKLDADGLTYPCFCSAAELSASRKRQLAAGQPARYAGTCRSLTEAQRTERLVRGQAAALRFRAPSGKTISFVDVVQGEQTFLSDDIGDFILRRVDGGTAFFFSNAIDDALMGVTLVLRGEDHLTKTPRQMMILEALGLPLPQYAHVALLLSMDGAPLSTRHGDLSLQGLRRRGYLAGAVRNHLVRLGHTVSSDRWLDDKALVAEFDLARLGKTAAKFDDAQLRRWQEEAVARLSDEDFLVWTADFLPTGVTNEQLVAFGAAIRGHVGFPSDAKRWGDVVFGTLPPYEVEALNAIKDAGASFYDVALAVFATTTHFESAARKIEEITGRDASSLYMSLRAALTGATHGPKLESLLALMTSDQLQTRLQAARLAAE